MIWANALGGSTCITGELASKPSFTCEVVLTIGRRANWSTQYVDLPVADFARNGVASGGPGRVGTAFRRSTGTGVAAADTEAVAASGIFPLGVRINTFLLSSETMVPTVLAARMSPTPRSLMVPVENGNQVLKSMSELVA